MTLGEWCALAAVTWGLTSRAHAQSAEAEVLFREGRKLIKDGKLAAGCDKLEASERVESSIGTLLNLGDCKENLGKLASAWGAFAKAEATAKRSGDEKRAAEAHRRAAALEPRLATLTIDVTRKVDGLVVRRDGEIVDGAAWHTAVPVDPGTYKIVAEAKGFRGWRGEIVVEGGGRRVITVPSLEPVSMPRVDSDSRLIEPTVVERPMPTLHMREPERESSWTGMRKLSLGLAVAGAGAIGGGVYFSLHARDLESDADRLCPSTACGDPMGLRLNRDAESSAKTANIFYIAGGSSLAAAVLLWFIGGPTGDHGTVVPTSSNGSVGLAYEGSL
jgi:hypothetical protein